MKALLIAATVTTALLLVACSPKDTATSASAPTVAPVASEVASVAAPENELGKKMFGKTCSLCHASGVGGAPKPGDKADWAPRIAQGMDMLYKHAKEGFTGTKGMMPPRGGAPTMTDDEIKAAVDYMANKSR